MFLSDDLLQNKRAEAKVHGLFGKRVDFSTRHEVNKNITFQNTTDVGKNIWEGTSAKWNVRRKILQDNIYRKLRGQGVGFLEARKRAKAQASNIIYNEMTGYQKHSYHGHHRRKHNHH